MRFRHLVPRVVLLGVISLYGWFVFSSCPTPGAEKCDAHPIPTPPSTGVSCPVTWVTAYYRSPSKHSFEEYNEWIRNFQAIRMCVVVFTDALELWHNTPNTTLVIPSNLCPVSLHHLNLSVVEWQRQLSIDPQCRNHIHYRVYWVWTLKAFFLNATATGNPFHSTTFFWIDAGYFRDNRHDNLDILSMQAPSIHGILFLQIYPFHVSETILENGRVKDLIAHDRIAGGLFGGNASAVMAWCNAYQSMLMYYQEKHWFIGKEQNLLISICLEQPSLCSLIQPDPYLHENPWFSSFEWVTTI